MTDFIRIHGIFPDAVVAKLKRVCPEGVDVDSFQCRLPAGDSKAGKVQAILRAGGLKPWMNHFRERAADEYWVEVEREYDEEDLAAAEFLALNSRTSVDGLFRSRNGNIRLVRKGLWPKYDLAFTGMPWLVVPDRVRRLIEASGLIGVSFRPTHLVSGETAEERKRIVPWSTYGKPWWELSSDVTLPPLSPSAEVFDQDGKRIAGGDCSNGCYVRTGLIVDGELRYTRAALRAAGAFDLARTTEVFGAKGHTDTRRFVASRRFHEWWTANRLKGAVWAPVRIDAPRARRAAGRPKVRGRWGDFVR